MKQLVVSISEELFNKMVDVSKLPELELARDFTKAFVKSIVNGKPLDSVLDEIRADIEEMKIEDNSHNICFKVHNDVVESILQIIDKHKESDDYYRGAQEEY